MVLTKKSSFNRFLSNPERISAKFCRKFAQFCAVFVRILSKLEHLPFKKRSKISLEKQTKKRTEKQEKRQEPFRSNKGHI